mmetsp:Transcript_64031/g.202571  ORF Transcript_64031/g.202571 Transcript_64031/m.202571 type:complete len:312 (-) Transcript_64031:9-944(-)
MNGREFRRRGEGIPNRERFFHGLFHWDVKKNRKMRVKGVKNLAANHPVGNICRDLHGLALQGEHEVAEVPRVPHQPLAVCLVGQKNSRRRLDVGGLKHVLAPLLHPPRVVAGVHVGEGGSHASGRIHPLFEGGEVLGDVASWHLPRPPPIPAGVHLQNKLHIRPRNCCRKVLPVSRDKVEGRLDTAVPLGLEYSQARGPACRICAPELLHPPRGAHELEGRGALPASSAGHTPRERAKRGCAGERARRRGGRVEGELRWPRPLRAGGAQASAPGKPGAGGKRGGQRRHHGKVRVAVAVGKARGGWRVATRL